MIVGDVFMKKKIFTILLSALILCLCVPISTACKENPNFSSGLEYELINNNTEYQVKGLGTCTDTKIIIPSIHNNIPVKSIKNSAFAECNTLTNVIIPNSVTNIGFRAFYYCDSLKSIIIPNSVTSIGASAFESCNSLNFNIKDGLKYLGNSENKYLYLADTVSTNITSATIDSGCRFIGDYAFSWCDSLTNVMISNNVLSIGKNAFEYCNSLESIELPNSITSIGYYAFAYCNLKSVTISENVTSLASKLFYYCTSLTSVTIGNKVTNIGYEAFRGCYSLNSIKYRGAQSQWSKINKDSSWDLDAGSYEITYNYLAG